MELKTRALHNLQICYSDGFFEGIQRKNLSELQEFSFGGLLQSDNKPWFFKGLKTAFTLKQSAIKERVSLHNGFSDSQSRILFHMPHKIGESDSIMIKYIDVYLDFNIRQPVRRQLFYFDFEFEPDSPLIARFFGLGESRLH